jgi:hypothetical protein
MDKQELLTAKAEELTANLTEWASGNGILMPGEKVFLTLRIGPTSPTPLYPRQDKAGGAVFKYVRPAQLTTEEIQQVLRLFMGNARILLDSLLVSNANEATKHSSNDLPNVDFYQINKKLVQNPTNGKIFRLVHVYTGREFLVQLWELEGAPSPAARPAIPLPDKPVTEEDWTLLLSADLPFGFKELLKELKVSPEGIKVKDIDEKFGASYSLVSRGNGILKKLGINLKVHRISEEHWSDQVLQVVHVQR